MKTEFIDGLELLIAEPAKPRPLPPLLFIHGAFAGAWMWAERFLPVFAEAGFTAYALSLRGHGRSHGAGFFDQHGIRDYVDDVATAVERIGGLPVLIGHSMGGFVVQKYLERYPARAAVLMSAVPPQGLMAASFHLLFSSPSLFVDFNRLLGGNDITPDAVRRALFAKPMDDKQVAAYSARMSMESQRAIWDMTMFNLVNLAAVNRVPLQVIGAEHDMLIPSFLVQATARSYGVDDRIYAGFGHGFPLEPGAERIAADVVDWLERLVP